MELRTGSTGKLDIEDFDHDTLATVAEHFRATVLDRRIPQLVILHYADMIADRHGVVRQLSEGAQIEAHETLIDEVVNATSFETMRAGADSPPRKTAQFL
jgi:aryl sulfotransferase